MRGSGRRSGKYVLCRVESRMKAGISVRRIGDSNAALSALTGMEALYPPRLGRTLIPPERCTGDAAQVFYGSLGAPVVERSVALLFPLFCRLGQRRGRLGPFGASAHPRDRLWIGSAAKFCARSSRSPR